MCLEASLAENDFVNATKKIRTRTQPRTFLKDQDLSVKDQDKDLSSKDQDQDFKSIATRAVPIKRETRVVRLWLGPYIRGEQ